VVEGQESAATLPARPPTIRLTPVLNGSTAQLPNVPESSLAYQATAPSFNDGAFRSGLNNQATALSAQSPPYNADGTFRFDRLRPGTYRLHVSAFEHYVKEVRYGGSDVLGEDFTITGNSGPMTIVLSANTGVVSGRVSLDSPASLVGAIAILVPERNRLPERVKAVAIDEAGVFRIPGVAPGDYHAFAAVAREPNPFLNSEFRERFAAYAVPVHVTAGANPSIVLKVIPDVKP
jgi:hypothetical protein